MPIIIHHHHHHASSDPVALLQLERQVDLGQVLEAEGRQRLDLGLLLGAQHQLELGDPRGVGADEVLLELIVMVRCWCVVDGVNGVG